jgi:hypothetical protein
MDTMKAQRAAERDAMKKMIAEKRKQRMQESSKQAIDETMILVKEPKYPLRPFIAPEAITISMKSASNEESIAELAEEASIIEEVVDEHDDVCYPEDIVDDLPDDVVFGQTWIREHHKTVDLVTAMEYSYLLAQMQEILQLPSTTSDKQSVIPEEESDADDDAFEDESVEDNDLSMDNVEEDLELEGDEPDADDDGSLSYSNHMQEPLSPSKISSMDETVFMGIKQGYQLPHDDENASQGTFESIGSDIEGAFDDLERLEIEIQETSSKPIPEINNFLRKKLGSNKLEEVLVLLRAIDSFVETDEDEEDFLSAVEDILGHDNLPYLELLYKVLTL